MSGGSPVAKVNGELTFAQLLHTRGSNVGSKPEIAHLGQTGVVSTTNSNFVPTNDKGWPSVGLPRGVLHVDLG